MKYKRKKPGTTCKKHGKSCYAIALNKAGDKGQVLSMEVCQKCDSHLAASGICLNGCHLPPKTMQKFNTIMGLIAHSRNRVGV